jgi:ABC-type sugar transport system substrate-binding protein
MENKHSKLGLVLMTLVLLLVLALGSVAPGAFAREAGLRVGATGLSEQIAFVGSYAIDGGGSGT